MATEPAANAPDLSFGEAAQAILDAATAAAQSKRRDHVTTHHLLYAIAEADGGEVAALVTAAGGDLAKLSAECQSLL